MQLDHTPLHQSDQRGKRIGGKVHRLAAALGHLDPSDRFVDALVRVLLIEALRIPAVGAADEAERAIAQVRKDPIRNLLVVEREIALGELRFRKELLVGMGQRNACDGVIRGSVVRRFRAARLSRRSALWRFAPRCRLRCGPLAHDIGGFLVFAQSLEGGVTQRSVVAPFRERDLGHELRLDPVRALGFEASRRIGEGRRRLLELVQHRAQLCQGLVVESGPDLAGIAELARFVDAEQQRAESPAAALRIGESADDHFLPLAALDLDPLARAHTRAVERVGALRDRAFEPESTRLLEKLRAGALNVGAVAQRRIRAFQQLLQQALALG